MSVADDSAARLAEDEAARERALDVSRSFLVQAPAGSGKTELLIQRLLALLGRVERPERVLAITFTRKAAGEMRERVVRALAAAADLRVDEAALRPHERTTRRLARAALAQDARHGWHLVEHPSRLGIQTIDALVQAIALQAPLASGLPPAPRFAEHAKPLYVAAARAAIIAADPDDADWRRLLEHQDNDANALAALLADMLGKRDQWRSLVVGAGVDTRAALEAALEREVTGELAEIASVLVGADFAPMSAFAATATANLDDSQDALRAALAACVARRGPPPGDLEHFGEWRALAAWLLTQAGGLRKLATGMVGVPPVGEGPGRESRSAHARAVKAWLERLAACPGLEAALQMLRILPPTRYTDDEWATIASLDVVLQRVAAQLEAVFAAERVIDFPRATLGALAALGEGEAPSELLMRLDLRIDHLLVDEFQDTSYAHLELIRRLVSGWNDGEGRTLFAVGDPMQSIYRFRGAEVRAFVEAQAACAVEGIAVEPLTLRRNFRSHAGLVDWVNATFPSVLGPTSDPWLGRVAFADAVAVVPVSGAAASVEVATSAADEAARIVTHVREALAAGGNVAILARARSHLVTLLPALRDASIPYAPVDVDTLFDRAAVRDVVALAHALVQPADRLAWLAVLRAPWCGLALADLDAIVQAADDAPVRSIEDVVLAPPPTLSREGAARLATVAAVVDDARRTRARAPLAERVRAAWLALGGPATLDEQLDLVAVDGVFALLAEHARAGDVPDWSAFVAGLVERKLAPPPGGDGRVQVMTMHKAKGLEFDTVILPGLARGPGRHSTDLLRWRTRRNGLLIGLARAKGGEHGGVYAYLHELAKIEEEAELARLAYVACTRAKRRLVITSVVAPGADDDPWKTLGRSSILGLLGRSVLEGVEAPKHAAEVTAAAAAPAAITRLPIGWIAPAPAPPLVIATPMHTVEAAPPFDWARERARRLGVVVHLLLAQIAAEGLVRWNDATLAAQAPRIEAALVGEGALPAGAAAETADVRATVATVLRDARGRWLFDPTHADAHSEWALAGIDDGDIVHIVLDRTFVADGVRWIVDFKTGTHEGADPSSFLDAEVARYRPQLSRYARIVAALDPEHPVKLALYHPRVPGGWRVVPS